MPPLPLLPLVLLLLAQSARAALVDERTLPLRGSSTPASLFVPRGFVSDDAAARAAADLLNGDVPPPAPIVVVLRGMCAYAAFDAPFARAAAAALNTPVALLTAPRLLLRCPCRITGYAPAGAITPHHSGASAAPSPAAHANACPAWDATAACCQAVPAPGGDVGFVLDAIADINGALNATGRPVSLISFSVGAFMGLRMACDAPPGVLAGVVECGGGEDDAHHNPGGGAAAASLSLRARALACTPAAPVRMIMVHSWQDEEVPFEGGPGQVPGTRVAAANDTPAARVGAPQRLRRPGRAARVAAAAPRAGRRGRQRDHDARALRALRGANGRALRERLAPLSAAARQHDAALHRSAAGRRVRPACGMRKRTEGAWTCHTRNAQTSDGKKRARRRRRRGG
jgi:hypothetical protein